MQCVNECVADETQQSTGYNASAPLLNVIAVNSTVSSNVVKLSDRSF
jgi:hypothetical protein